MLDILLQVLSALAAAHQRGVVHRDLKPENIFLSRREGMRPVPKLLDFGISKAIDIEESQSDTTGSDLAAGTPYYMAPEQARGDRRVDWRVDLWAVGVVLYEGLTGRRPFSAKNFNALLQEIQHVPHRSILDHDPTLAAGLAKVIDKALAKIPDERYQSAIDFQRALRKHNDLEQSAPKQIIPIVINEQTEDEDDGTHVFSRLLPIGGRGVVLGNAQGLGARGAAGEHGEETGGGDDAEADELDDAKTPIYSSDPAPADEERTVIDEPRFENDTVTAVRPDPRAPGGKR